MHDHLSVSGGRTSKLENVLKRSSTSEIRASTFSSLVDEERSLLASDNNNKAFNCGITSTSLLPLSTRPLHHPSLFFSITPFPWLWWTLRDSDGSFAKIASRSILLIFNDCVCIPQAVRKVIKIWAPIQIEKCKVCQITDAVRKRDTACAVSHTQYINPLKPFNWGDGHCYCSKCIFELNTCHC